MAENNNNSSQKCVLLVDDNPVNRKVGKVLMEQFQLDCDVAASGQEALQALAEKNYAVILMDCVMPDMDGFETTMAIRKLERLKGSYTPIIACTAKCMAGDIQRCIAAGMDDFIPKPIDKELLRVKLNHWAKTEVVQQSQVLHKMTSGSTAVEVDETPTDMAELEEFFGAEELYSILDTFLQTSEQKLDGMRYCIKERRYELVVDLAHELKGASASIGAKDLSRLSLQLEQAAGAREWREMQSVLERVEVAFEKLQIFIQDYLRAHSAKVHTTVRQDAWGQ
ncbi:MAG TPA: response regulator [Candidatus Obscuribacterales bacterium]